MKKTEAAAEWPPNADKRVTTVVFKGRAGFVQEFFLDAKDGAPMASMGPGNVKEELCSEFTFVLCRTTIFLAEGRLPKR